MSNADDPFRARLAALKPSPRGHDPSPARQRIREAFKAITAARTRGVTWAQIAEALHDEGVRDPHGERLTVNEVRALYHAERALIAARAERQKGKPERASPARPGVPEPPPATPTRPEVGPPAPPPPAPAASNPANPWAEIDQRAAEAKRRRDERAAGREWNPYATPRGKERPE